MLPNSFIKKFSWVLLFSMLFSLFSVFPEEPAYAAGEFSCFNSDGKAYAYQSVWDSTHLDVYRWEATTGQTAANDGNATLVAIFTASDFSPHHGDISEVNSFMMDRDGNAYAILKEDDSDNSAHLFKLNMPSSGTDGTATDMGQISDGDNNAGTYYENNGHKYLITSNGFMKGNNVAIRLNSDGSTTQISINRTGESGTSKAKDFTWLPNANFSGLSDGVSPDIIGFDRKNTKVYYGYISHTNQGASDEGVTVNVQSQSVSTPSGWSGSGNAAGAVFGFGKDEIYAINNNTGQLYSIDYSSGFSLSEAQFSSQDLYANNTTNNDGAACHEGSATVDWDPTLTAAQGTCDGSNRGIAVTLNNSSGGIAATYAVSYTVNGGGSNTLEAAEVVAAGNSTVLNIPAQSDDAEIDILWSAANTDYLNNTPDSGTTTVEITVDASGCWTDPNSTVSQSLSATCASGAKTSTLSITNNAGATSYYYVQYQIDSEGWQNANTNLSVGAGVTNTTLTASVAHGKSIDWRYKDSAISNDFSGATYVTGSTNANLDSTTVDCDPDIDASQSLGSCASGAKTSTLSIQNNESSTVYVKIEYQIDSDGWLTKNSNFDISGSTTNSSAATHSVPHGSAITWRVTDSFTSADWTNMVVETESTSSTVDCDPNSTISQALTCSGTTATSTLSITNNESVAAFYKVEYKIGDGSYSTHSSGSNLEVAGGATNTSLTQTVSEGSTITWRVTDSFTDDNYTNMVTEGVPESSAANCVVSSTVSQSLGSCASGAKTSTLSITNNESVTAYYYVQYQIDSEGWQNANTNLSVSASATNTTLTASVPDGKSIDWRFKDSITSNDFSNATYETGGSLDSSTVDCDPDSTVSQSLGACSGTSKTSTLSIRNDESVTAYYKVDYRINSGDWVEVKGASDDLAVSAGATDTSLSQSVSDGSTITWRVTDSFTDGNYTNMSVETESASAEVDCDIDPGASDDLASCSGSASTSTLTLTNTNGELIAYFLVEYSINGGTSYLEKEDNQIVSANGSATLTQSVSEGFTIKWRYKSSSSSGSFSGGYTALDESSTVSCTTTTTTTSTTTTTTSTTTTSTTTTSTTTTSTTTTLPKEVFKPVIKNNRTCNEGGGGNFGLSIDHRDSTVDAIIKLSVYIDKKIVSETTYKISSGTSAFITTIENVPEDSKYKLLISVKNTLNNKEASGKFVKKANCIKDADETTTTIPKLTTTTSISPTTTIDTDFDIDVDVGITTTTTTTIPPPTTTIPIDPDEGDPLTSEEGNDIYIWDFEEDIYFTDGDFIVTYLYQENSITMADTGLNLTFINYEEVDPNYLYYGSVTSFLLGIGFFIRYRKRRLLNKTSSLQKVYENASTLKEALESIVQTKVKITFDNDEKHNPENKKLKKYSHLLKELQYTTVAIQNIKTKDIFRDIDRSVIIKILQDNLTSLNNAGFTIIFSDEQALLDKKTSSVTEITSRKNKLKKKKVKRNGFLIAASFTMMSFIIGFYAFQQTFLTNTQQIAAQEELKEIFTNESPVEEIYERKFNLNLDFSNDENEAGLFPEIREILSLRSNTTKEVEDASVFGFLEIPEINLEQYVVIGTSEAELQLGPGYYLGTEIPGSGGNVGIAGHRTTHGAPFGDLHLVNVGDAINLTFAGNKYQYIIDQIHVVPARGGEYLLYNNGVDRLTLTTCHPRYSGKERLVVSGILKKIQSSA